MHYDPPFPPISPNPPRKSDAILAQRYDSLGWYGKWGWWDLTGEEEWGAAGDVGGAGEDVAGVGFLLAVGLGEVLAGGGDVEGR